MYYVFICPSELLTRYEVLCKFQTPNITSCFQYDHYIELLDKVYLHTTFIDDFHNVMVGFLAIGSFFSFSFLF